MTKKQVLKKLSELKQSLGMAQYRGAAMFPGPGVDEDIERITKEIKKLKKDYNL